MPAFTLLYTTDRRTDRQTDRMTLTHNAPPAQTDTVKAKFHYAS